MRIDGINDLGIVLEMDRKMDRKLRNWCVWNIFRLEKFTFGLVLMIIKLFVNNI